MSRTTPRRRILAAGAVVAVAVLGGVGPAAGAAGDWRATWLVDDAATLLHPGATAPGTLRVDNSGATPLRVDLLVLDVVDDENGCLRTERQSALEDCGAGRGTGELSSQLWVTVSSGGVDLHDGPLLDLVDRASGAVLVAPGSRVDLAVDLHLPQASTNETMTDAVSFTLRARAGADLRDVDVSTEAGTRDDTALLAQRQGRGVVGGIGGLLPDVGNGEAVQVAGFGLALAGAWLLLLAAARRRDRRAA